MDFGIKINKLEQLKKNLAKYKFIYFGNEFCERKIPSIEFSKQIFDFCKKNNKIPVLLTPFLTDIGIKKTKKIITLLVDLNQQFELTINDLGLLSFLTTFTNIKINCGRLLIKMKKGPEISSGVLNIKNDFKNNSLNNPLFIEFMKNQNVFRFETDLPSQGIFLPNNENITLYLGNSVISVTRRCPFIDCFKEDYNYAISECNQECLSVGVVKNTEFYEEMIYMLGNAELLKTKKEIPLKLKNCFNRIVIFASLKDVL